MNTRTQEYYKRQIGSRIMLMIDTHATMMTCPEPPPHLIRRILKDVRNIKTMTAKLNADGINIATPNEAYDVYAWVNMYQLRLQLEGATT